MSEKSVAETLFDAIYAHSNAEDVATYALIAACDIDTTKPETWPMQDFSFDPYDSSFEFHGIGSDWCPTVEQLRKCWALGFDRCWICYADNTERSCAGDSISERYMRPTAMPVVHDGTHSPSVI